jgi:uncharacterized protein DUF1707
MDTDGRGFPLGDMRVSDADRDRALSELSVAFQDGRITADEFDQRSGQVLGSRTGKELSALLADLPAVHAPADSIALRPAGLAPVGRIMIGASVAAGCFAIVAINNALSSIQQEQIKETFIRLGIPDSQNIQWGATITPAVIAVVLVVLVIFLRMARTGRA